MSTALLVVDFQNDFVDGSLAVPNAEETLEPILQLAKLPEVDLIVMSRDWHPADHVSFSDAPEYKDYSWPPHCVQNTRGAEFAASIGVALMDLGKPIIVVTKGDNWSKEAYSAFDGHTPMVEERINGGGESFEYEAEASLASALDQKYGIDKVIVVGLALDYCVRASALDSVKHGFHTVVDLAGTRAVTPETGAKAIEDLLASGATLHG